MIRDDPTDPANLSPQERLAELAGILAGAINRLRKRSALTATVSPQTPLPKSDENQLDVSARKSVHGQCG